MSGNTRHYVGFLRNHRNAEVPMNKGAECGQYLDRQECRVFPGIETPGAEQAFSMSGRG